MVINLVPSWLVIVTCLLDKSIGIDDGIKTRDKLSVLRRTVSPGTNYVAKLFFDRSSVNTSSGMTGCLRGLQTAKNENKKNDRENCPGLPGTSYGTDMYWKSVT